MCSSHAPKYSLMLLYPIPLQSYFPCFPLHKISIEYTHLYSITESEKERASPLANRPPAARNSGFAYALSIHRPMQRDTRHSTDWLLTLQYLNLFPWADYLCCHVKELQFDRPLIPFRFCTKQLAGHSFKGTAKHFDLSWLPPG